jgi:GxxExxY protein
MGDMLFKDESYAIVGACFEVYNELGPGFLEAVYHESLEYELTERGIPFVSKPRLTISFKGAVNALRSRFFVLRTGGFGAESRLFWS